MMCGLTAFAQLAIADEYGRKFWSDCFRNRDHVKWTEFTMAFRELLDWSNKVCPLGAPNIFERSRRHIRACSWSNSALEEESHGGRRPSRRATSGCRTRRRRNSSAPRRCLSSRSTSPAPMKATWWYARTICMESFVVRQREYLHLLVVRVGHSVVVQASEEIARRQREGIPLEYGYNDPRNEALNFKCLQAVLGTPHAPLSPLSLSLLWCSIHLSTYCGCGSLLVCSRFRHARSGGSGRGDRDHGEVG